MNYWKSATLLLKEITSNLKFYEVNSDLKSEIISKMKNLVVNVHYLVSRLLIYNKINELNFLNFLFYISINREILYKLFLVDACKFAKTFVFPIQDKYLPNVQLVFSESELNKLKLEINLAEILRNIHDISPDQLKVKFPKCYYFTLINPKSLEY